MRIIQIVGGGVTSDGDEGTVYGLGDDGGLYEFFAGSPARYYGTTTAPRYVDGATRGWRLVCTSDARSVPLPHPEDPTRHFRS